jgi:hypothetical protein
VKRRRTGNTGPRPPPAARWLAPHPVHSSDCACPAALLAARTDAVAAPARRARLCALCALLVRRCGRRCRGDRGRQCGAGGPAPGGGVARGPPAAQAGPAARRALRRGRGRRRVQGAGGSPDARVREAAPQAVELCRKPGLRRAGGGGRARQGLHARRAVRPRCVPCVVCCVW